MLENIGESRPTLENIQGLIFDKKFCSRMEKSNMVDPRWRQLYCILKNKMKKLKLDKKQLTYSRHLGFAILNFHFDDRIVFRDLNNP